MTDMTSVSNGRARVSGAARRDEGRWPWRRAGALIVVCIGAGLLIYFGRVARPLWLDEEMIALNVRDRSFAQLAGPLWLGQAAPLGWMALVRAALVTFGSSERALRLVPVLFGVATLATIWWVGRRWLNPVGATVLAMLAASGNHVWFFSLELKHYSADTFGGLLVPALAAWALEAPPEDASRSIRRADRWWLVAALVQWCSYGALLVMPACAAVAATLTWRKDGWRGMWRGLRYAPVWGACVALHYFWAIRYATGSQYLHGYWDSGFPPPAAGVAETLRWLAGRFEPLAINPGGATVWTLFWAVAGTGLAIAIVTRPALGLVLATAPVSAFVLVAVRAVPLSGRLSLWIVPALYFGVAVAADTAVQLWRTAPGRAAIGRRATAIMAAALVLWFCVDVFRTGERDMASRTLIPHGVDDRAAVRFLLAQRHPGDALLAMHLTLPAVWWYGHVPLSNWGGVLPDGGRLFEVEPASTGPDCLHDQLGQALRGIGGVGFYMGFDQRPDFNTLLLNRLGELGALTAYKAFDSGQTALFDLSLAPSGKLLPPGYRPITPSAGMPDCVAIHDARRW
jgi:hypothetical protein